jgi:HlyD family secretion protein
MPQFYRQTRSVSIEKFLFGLGWQGFEMTLQNEAEAKNDAAEADVSPRGLGHNARASDPVSPERPRGVVTRLPALRQHKWLVGMAVLAAIVIAYLIMRHFEGTEVVVETVVASGHVESPNRVAIASQITGVVASVAVREGETVRQGQPLIFLSANELTSAVSQAQGAVAAAQAQIRQVRELSLPQARQAQRTAASNALAAEQVFSRASALLAKGFVTSAYFDDVKKNRDVAAAQVQTAKAQVRSAGNGGSDFASAQAALSQAQASAAAATSRLAYTTLSAPRSGVLIARNVERGTVVTPGAALMILSPQGQTQIVLQIDERNLNKIAVGQWALVSADAYPALRFLATIAFINPGVDITRASVKLSVVNPPAYLREDMTVSVDIEVARRHAVLVLPNGAVHDALSSKPWVITVENGRSVRHNVTLGLRGNTQIEIISGIRSDAVSIPVASQIKIGARVKPAERTAAK